MERPNNIRDILIYLDEDLSPDSAPATIGPTNRNFEYALEAFAHPIHRLDRLNELAFFGVANGQTNSLYIVNAQKLRILADTRVINVPSIRYVFHFEGQKFDDLTRDFITTHRKAQIEKTRFHFQPIVISDNTMHQFYEFVELQRFLELYRGYNHRVG